MVHSVQWGRIRIISLFKRQRRLCTSRFPRLSLFVLNDIDKPYCKGELTHD